MEYEIKPNKVFKFGFRELLKNRELLYFFVWRDLKVKYKQTALGVLWVIFQPLALMLLFTLLLGTRYKSEFPAGNYSVYVLSGIICWNFFSGSVSAAGNSMVSNSSIIKKVYFPRLIVPLSSVISALVDFSVAMIVYLFILLFVFDVGINWSGFVFFPVAVITTVIASFGVGTLISALNVKYRDFRYILPFFIQLLMFVSPVFLIVTNGSNYDYLFALNPMYAPLEFFRMHFLSQEINWSLIFVSLGINVTLLFIGIVVFRKMEDYFADLA